MPPKQNPIIAFALSIFFLLPAAWNPAGELTEDTTWSGVHFVDETVVVPDGMVLNIEAGAEVRIADANSIIVYGQLIADGTETQPITFTHYDAGIRW